MPKDIIKKPLTKGYYKGWTRNPWVIILHYTASFTAKQTYDILNKRKLSIHSCIERDGTKYQYLSEDNRALHAGYGTWCGRSNMNNHSLGIEIVNFGWGDGEFDSSYKGYIYRNPHKEDPELIQGNSEWYRDETYKTKKGKVITTRVVTKQTMVSRPDHREEYKSKEWAIYPDQQMTSVCEQVWDWIKLYKILPENVIGHEHVTPHRKTDPGPAFPWLTLENYLTDKIKNQMPELLDINLNERLRTKAVQSHCARMGLPVGDIDGWWGNNTERSCNMAVEKYGELYGFPDLDINKHNLTQIANKFRFVPGFDTGRR